ncbi:MAG TPA: SRPBCC family protein [Rariglobus sp.]|nr:SRPBCC family protein [Rariglobus sp.]
MPSLSRAQLNWTGVIIGLLYGLFARLMFGLDASRGLLFEVMSSSFILGVPVVLGFLTVWLGEYRKTYSWGRRVLLPWLPSLLCLGCSLLLVWEGLICVILWLPLFLVLSSFGGLLAGLIRYSINSDSSRNYCAAIVALIPFIAAPLESLRDASTEIHRVETSIEINASPAAVWDQIKSVPRIAEAEHSFNFSHPLGFPRPTEALLEGTGVGAVRYARFEGNVLFIERITEWQEPARISFSIQADTANIPPDTFDEHVTIGGPYFDVLHGTYRIETLGSGRVLLHLSSDQRLSTRFNFYSHLWTEALMADLQNYILRIIKARCEKV